MLKVRLTFSRNGSGVVFVYISQQREKIYYFICFNTLFSILRYQLATFDIVRYSSSPIKCQEVWNNVIEVKSDNKELNVNFTVLILFNCALWSNSWQSKVCINCKMEFPPQGRGSLSWKRRYTVNNCIFWSFKQRLGVFTT